MFILALMWGVNRDEKTLCLIGSSFFRYKCRKVCLGCSIDGFVVPVVH